MTRLQISEDFGRERLRTQAQPNTPTVQAAAPVENSAWKSLANALDGGASLAEQMRLKQEQDDRDAAKKYAQSMTVGELHRKVTNGEMMPSQSPVFAATVQHIWGENSHEALSREVISKVATGELKFATSGEADTYLTEARNTALSGQGKYATAGFDKGFSTFRDKLMSTVNSVNDKTQVEAAKVQAGDSLGNTLNAVTGPDFKGTPQESATAVMAQYQLLRSSTLLAPGADKEALKDVLARASAGGKPGVLDAILNSNLPNIGSVRGFIGETHAATLANHATVVYDGQQRQRIDTETLPWMQKADTGELPVEKFMEWAQSPANSKYTTASSIHSVLSHNTAMIAHQQRLLQKSAIEGEVQRSVYEAEKLVDAKLSSGTLWEAQGTNNPMVLTHTGEPKKFDVKAYAEKALVRKTAGLPFDQQVSAWAMNGITNPDWHSQMQAGLFNLSSVGVASPGKPAGTLNDAGRKAIDLFRQMDRTNPDAAKQTAGEDGYRRFSDIGFLMHLGRAPEDAAAIASSAASGAVEGSAVSSMTKAINQEVGKLTDGSWMDWLENKGNQALDVGSEALRMGNLLNPLHTVQAHFKLAEGDWRGAAAALWSTSPSEAPSPMHNSVANTIQVHSAVKRYATLLAHSGQYGTTEGAIKAAVDYIADPAVSAKVNGTLYLRSEMPAAPGPSRSAEAWLGKFIDEVPKARAKELKFAGSEVRLEYDERANLYRAFVSGLPLMRSDGAGVMAFQKGEIQAWYSQREQQEVQEAVTNGAYGSYRNRMDQETGRLQKGDRFVMERYDGMLNKPKFIRNIYGKDAFDRIRRDGNHLKPLDELMKLYP